MNLEFLSGGIGLFIIIILVVWSVLWFMVPFYISSLNKNIRQLLDVNRQILKCLRPEPESESVSEKKYYYEPTEEEKEAAKKIGVKL